MAKTCWALALCLLTTTAAFAQAPRGRDAGADFGEDENAPPERGERGEGGPGGRFGRGAEGEEGGRFGGGFGGRGFRRGNAMFTALDADSDGSISKAELRKAAAALATLDTDGDGAITQEEASGPGGPGGPGGPMGDPSQMVDRVMSADQNGDGKITPDEVNDPRMGMMLRGADADGDGAVSKAEIETAMQRMGGGPGGGGFGGPGGGFGRGGGDMTQRFMSMDKNGDGKITTDEATEQARPMLRQADADGNGEVDAKEIEQFGRQMGGRARGAFGGQGGPGGQNGPGGRFGRGGNDDASGAGGERPQRRSRRGDDEAEQG